MSHSLSKIEPKVLISWNSLILLIIIQSVFYSLVYVFMN